MSDVLSVRARLAASVDVVYRALTDAAALEVWLAEHAEVDLVAGRYEFWGRYTPQGERGRQQLTGVETGKSLSFRWVLDGRSTNVGLRLTPGGDRTVLRLTEDGLPTIEELMAPTGRRDGLHSMHTFWSLSVANLAAYVEGRELTPKADFGPDRPTEIHAEITVAAPPHRVFASLTEPKLIERWFGVEGVELEPRIGGRATVGIEGKIFEFEPGRRLSIADDEGAIVRWELADSGGATRLTFVQSGYTEDERDNAAQHEAGWFAALAELRRLHELGDDWEPLTTELPSGE
jgi:uncharacterized protein YndB with AHSA1/START domain